MKQTFREFSNELSGNRFYSKKTGKQVYQFQMYWSDLTPKQCFERYEVRAIPKSYSLN